MTDEAFATTRRYLTDRQIVEVLQLVGFYWGVARMSTLLELELDIPEGLESITAVATMDR